MLRGTWTHNLHATVHSLVVFVLRTILVFEMVHGWPELLVLQVHYREFASVSHRRILNSLELKYPKSRESRTVHFVLDDGEYRSYVHVVHK